MISARLGRFAGIAHEPGLAGILAMLAAQGADKVTLFGAAAPEVAQLFRGRALTIIEGEPAGRYEGDRVFVGLEQADVPGEPALLTDVAEWRALQVPPAPDEAIDAAPFCGGTIFTSAAHAFILQKAASTIRGADDARAWIAAHLALGEAARDAVSLEGAPDRAALSALQGAVRDATRMACGYRTHASIILQLSNDAAPPFRGLRVVAPDPLHLVREAVALLA